MLKDDLGVLVSAQAGKTKAQRHWRMHSARDIRKADIRRYVEEAKTLVGDGRQMAPRQPSVLTIPDELSAALRSETRLLRVEKSLPLIRARSGLSDRYRQK
jgi:uncharacterized protein YdeI (YjbR/CyaY-like superfamily)